MEKRDRQSPLDTAFLKELVVECYKTEPSLSAAARAAGVLPVTARQWKLFDPEFAEKLSDAREEYRDRLRELAEQRATGFMRPVMYKGEVQYVRNPVDGTLVLDENFEPIVQMEMVHSDRILERLMEANLPEFKGGRGVGVGVTLPGAEGAAPTKIEVNFVSPPDWDKVEWDEETGRPKLDD
jgi:hypothetical protein